jgi:FAD/FMN-containing dehydrogenase
VVSLRVITASGEIRDLEAGSPDIGYFLATEGQMGIIVRATLRVGRRPSQWYPFAVSFDEPAPAYAFAKKLLETYGEKTAILCIGPAGELQLTAASVQTTDIDGRPCRAAGRGGLGAVMGAKGLKAVVVDQRGKSADAIADPKAFNEAGKAFAQAIKAHPFSGQMLPALGTAGLVAPVNSMGAFPSYNATKGVLEAGKVR